MAPKLVSQEENKVLQEETEVLQEEKEASQEEMEVMQEKVMTTILMCLPWSRAKSWQKSEPISGEKHLYHGQTDRAFNFQVWRRTWGRLWQQPWGRLWRWARP